MWSRGTGDASCVGTGTQNVGIVCLLTRLSSRERLPTDHGDSRETPRHLRSTSAPGLATFPDTPRQLGGSSPCAVLACGGRWPPDRAGGPPGSTKSTAAATRTESALAGPQSRRPGFAVGVAPIISEDMRAGNRGRGPGPRPQRHPTARKFGWRSALRRRSHETLKDRPTRNSA
jgi:hypothetical protein